MNICVVYLAARNPANFGPMQKLWDGRKIALKEEKNKALKQSLIAAELKITVLETILRDHNIERGSQGWISGPLL